MSSNTSESTADDLRAAARAWLAEHWSGDPTTVAAALPDGSSQSFVEKVIDAGWAAPSWPVGRFGRGIAPEIGQVVAEEFAKVGAPGAGQDIANLWANTLLAAGQPALIDQFLRPLLLGKVNMCLLYSEPGAGSDLAGIQTRADRDGDEWIVSGQKVWTTGGRSADYALLITRSNWDVPKHRGITFFFFPMRQPGVEVRALRQATGDSRFNEVFITDARVPDANRLGEVGQGWNVLMTALAYERAVMGQTWRRRADREDEAVRDVDDEASAPVPDLSLLDLARATGRSTDPVIRQKLTRLHAMRQVNEWNNARAKAALEQGTSTPLVSLGKLAMSGMLHYAGSLQNELLGAEATLAGRDSPRAADATYSLLNAFFTSIGGGTDQIQRNIIGERILGLPKEPEVDKDIAFRDVRRS
ncbi:MAG: acyl-CoA dehydrogenase family protein [Actinomycetota bacterium]|nr:acyl-CoA dehydrogenase family protein [Actinomycetota bacterium]